MLSVPVIATGYGGHMDFCDDENAWLVDYQFARAETHLGWRIQYGPSLVQRIWRVRRALHGAPQSEHHLCRAGQRALAS